MRRQGLVNGVLLVLGLGSLAVVWATREAPTTAELASREGKLLPRFDKSAVTRLTLSLGAQRVALEPDPDAPGELRLVAPWRERADVATVNRLLGALDLASALRTAEGLSSEGAGLGPSALGIRVEMGQTAQLVTLGGPAPTPHGARYVEVTLDGKSTRYVVSEGVASELSVTLDQLRDPLLLEYGRSELRRIRMESSGATVELEQRGRGEFFVATKAGSELANREAVDRILTALSRLSADRFLDPSTHPPSRYQRALKVRAEPTDPKKPPVTLTFGDACAAAQDRVELLREQAGRSPRLGCVPADVLPPLTIESPAVRLDTLFAARPDEVEELRVKGQDGQYVLLRKDSGFLLRTPLEQSIGLDAGNERLSAILRTPGERLREDERSRAGLDRAAGELFVQVTATGEGSRREERVVVGAARADGSVCVERTLDHVVLCFTPEQAKLFEPDATLLRPLGLLSFAPSELKSLTTVSPEVRQTLSREGEGAYRLLEPAGYAHDGSLVADAVQILGTLRALRWVALDDEPRFGLGRPRLSVRMTFASDAPPRQLDVGAQTDGANYARLSPDPAVFLLPRAVVDDLSLLFIDRSLSPFGGQFDSATLKASHGTRTATQNADDRPSFDRPEAATLSSLKAERALHLGEARTNEGLAQPRLRITFRRGDSRAEVSIGACDTREGARFCYARRSDVDATFALPFDVARDLQTATVASP